MKVKDLIEKLKKYNPEENLEILIGKNQILRTDKKGHPVVMWRDIEIKEGEDGFPFIHLD